MKMTPHEFKLLRTYIHDLCGISIADGKEYLIEQRLTPLVREKGCSSFSEFYTSCCTKNSRQLRERITSLITTNETSFFRDQHPYQVFSNFLLPAFAAQWEEERKRSKFARPGKARIWSAACSTGQEPYSMAILISEFLRTHPACGMTEADFSILATDISTNAIVQAMGGVYPEHEMARGMPDGFKARYSEKVEGVWVLNDNVRSMIEFRQFNLTGDLTVLGSFQLILCRNVLIYFDTETKSRILSQFNRMLEDSGFLMIGSTENLHYISEEFDSFRKGGTVLYCKKGLQPTM